MIQSIDLALINQH